MAKKFDVQRTGGSESLLSELVNTREEAERLASECCQTIREQAMERDGVDPGYYADDVTIVEVDDEALDIPVPETVYVIRETNGSEYTTRDEADAVADTDCQARDVRVLSREIE